MGFILFFLKCKWIKGECRHLCSKCEHYKVCHQEFAYRYQMKLLAKVYGKYEKERQRK